MTAVLALALALATIPQASAPAQPKAPAKAPVATGAQIEQLISDGKAAEAVTQGRLAAAAHPDDPGIHLALARAIGPTARKASRQVNVALSKEDTARGEVRVEDADLHSATLKVEYDPALFEEAVGQAEFAIRLAPQRLDIRAFHCFLLTDAGRIDRAQAAITSALAALPKNAYTAKAMTAFGAERAKRGDPAGGAELLAPVAKAFPNDAAIQIDYANVLTRLGKKYESYEAFDRAMLLAPKDPKYARTKAIGAMLLRDYRRARSTFDIAFRLGHDVSDEFASYAAAYGLDPKGSAMLMHELGTQSPSADAAVVDLANAFARAGDAGASSKEAMALARSLLASQQYVFAIPVLDRAIRLKPGDTEATTMLKTAYRELGCEPLADAKRADQQTPKNP
jgi:tetratricopeptide (TPR) repeat protein